ncbi:restriction endonuclease subunit S [Listeria seeligeri]|uniref:restriction endonuclease subunit S n=1 Tax=Listeria seeligeri TaxID=1640 RepID=UPI0022EBEF32|nr:restriction endonuclease subunit S [Listeria seeligeri]
MKGERKTAPVIRFKGFSDAWEQRKLGELADIVGGGTPSTLNDEYWNGDIDWYFPAEIDDQIYVFGSQKKITQKGLEKSSAKILPVGSVLFTSRAGIGKTAILGKEGATNQGFQSILPYRDTLDSYFIFSLTHELKRYGEITGAGSTFVEVSGKQLTQMPILVPNLKEQQKIGTFFKQLDNTIALHQRKLDSLKLMKKGFLQLMFPKKGEKAPKLRFADSEERWEQRKLGEIFTERTERSDKGELISVTINSGIVKASELERKDNSSSNKSNYKVIKKGDIAYNSMRMWQGASGCSFYDGILSPAYTVISPKEDIDPNFMSYMFKKHEMIHLFQRNSQGLTSDTWNLKFPSLSTIKVKIPPYEEQVRIANLLQNTENIITFQQNKISQLQALKKAHLQNMFI